MRIRALLLLALVALACKDHERIDREAALKTNLARIRQAINAYRAANGSYPHALTDLVPRYLSQIPADPFGGEWRVTTEETVQPNSDFQTATTAAAPPAVIIDVRSNAPGTDRNGVPYANY